ncbi:hypothetical protein THASP1DRAFT_26946, partial [Thamnocephalis sphaerospora]
MANRRPTLHLRNSDENELVVLQKGLRPRVAEYAYKNALSYDLSSFGDKWREAGGYLTKLISTKNLKTRYQQVEIGYEDEKTLEEIQEKGVSFRGRQIPITRVYEACKTLVEVKVGNVRMSNPVRMTKALIESFNPFGKIVDVSLLMADSGRVPTDYASVIINTAVNVVDESRPLLLNVDNQQANLQWRIMERICRYCHQPGHTMVDCETLRKKKQRETPSSKRLRKETRDSPAANTSKKSDKQGGAQKPKSTGKGKAPADPTPTPA